MGLSNSKLSSKKFIYILNKHLQSRCNIDNLDYYFYSSSDDLFREFGIREIHAYVSPDFTKANYKTKDKFYIIKFSKQEQKILEIVNKYKQGLGKQGLDKQGLGKQGLGKQDLGKPVLEMKSLKD